MADPATTSTTVEGFGPGGPALIGESATATVGFYGATPVAQRSSSVQASSNLASSTDFGATQLAWAVEVTNTLVGLGIWKGSA